MAFIALVLFIARLVFRLPVRDFYKASSKVFVIPDLNKNFIPQGISYDSSTDNFFLTGYTTDQSAVPIYIVNKKSKKLVNSVKLANPDGTDFVSHAGGLTLFNDKIYLAGSQDCCFYVFDKRKIEESPKNGYVSYSEVVDLSNKTDGVLVAFTAKQNNLIFAGEFYKDIVYPTNELHHIPSADGMNKAIAVGFSLDGNIATPEVAYSLPNEIQGMCFGDDGIYLSRSWGASSSNIYKFNYNDIKQSGTIVTLGKEVPLYILDSSNMSKNYKIPPMAEEIEYVDGKIYITNESASMKYIFGKLTSGKWCYAAKLDY